MQVRFIDALEPRRHFDVTVAYDGRVMTVVGTEAGDRIEFTNRERTTLRVFDTSAGDGKPVDLGTYVSPKLVRVFGRGGDDGIIVSPRLRGITRFSLDGGDGNDALGGSPRDDTLFGGRGDDRLAGAAGNDYLDGSAGDDYLEDARGVNVLHGGGGSDRSIGDLAKLGSGIERRLYSGENVGGGRFLSGETELLTRERRMILRYAGFLPSIANSVGQTGPDRRRDGHYDVTATYRVSGGGAIVGDFDISWDLTDVARDGVIFTVFDDGFEGPAFSLPFLLPTR
ncbi:MAG TPA: hypothetical protein VF624_08810 [Tepidisphaeraceae bacterium]|jgi:hypothetical protein